MRHVLLLRGINIGPRRRVAMADLRALLTDAGHEGVATYVQSGNIVLASRRRPATLEREVAELIGSRFGFEVPVTARRAAELDAVLAHDPIDGAAADPKRYQVTFLAEPAPAEAVERLRGLSAGDERLVANGRELYSWHPDGIAGSRLAAGLSAPALGGSATTRNWTTITTLARMARD